MPRGNPPAEKVVVLHHAIPAGQFLWRVSQQVFVRDASLFNPKLAPEGVPQTYAEIAQPGGRFDATAASPYSYCYAALDDLTAVAETLLRDVAFPDAVRPVEYAKVSRRCLVVYETLRPLTLVALTTASQLARARQDTWLIQAEESEYWRTRAWGHWLRTCSPEAHGFIWPSKRNPGGQAVILFGERCGKSEVARQPVFVRDLDGGSGLEWLNNRLSDLNTFVVPPIAHRDAGIGRG
jgi:hypothetical protein